MSSSAGPGSRSSKLQAVGVGCLAIGLVALCQLPALRFGFLDWDDPEHVTRNPAVLAPATVSLREHLSTPALGYPIPVTQASYLLEAQLFGLAPWHFHLLNVALHLLNCGWLYALGLRFGLRRSGALCALLLFGLHPVVAEPVSWVTGRKDLLSCCLGLSALWLAGPPSVRRRQVASVVCYGLGLLSKPSLAPLCLLAPLSARLFGGERSGLLRRSVPYVGVLAPIAVLGFLGQRAAGAIADPGRENAGFARAVWYALGHHLRLLFGLEEPTAKYLPQPWPPGFVPALDLLPLAAAGAAGLLMFTLPEKQRRCFGFGLLWAVSCYLPNSNLIPLARFLADSYLYLPLVGAAWCAGALVDAGLELVRSQWLQYAPPLIVVLACLPGSLHSQSRFADDEALWTQALRRYAHPRVCRLWANGVAKRRGPAGGLQATELCMREFGDSLFAKNRAILLARLGRFDEAREQLEREQRKHPEDAGVRRALEDLAAQSGSRQGCRGDCVPTGGTVPIRDPF
jgi:hypothetical protein